MVSLFVMLKDKNESYDYKSFLNFYNQGLVLQELFQSASDLP